MAKIATRKVGSIEKLQAALQKTSGSWLIQSVPKDEPLTVRFLTEPEEWIGYDEVWDSSIRKFFPATEGFVAGDDQRISHRYLANALTNDGKVIGLRLSRDLANRLMTRYERYGTLMDRDYELARYGEGFDTTYEVTPESPAKRSLKKYPPLDLEEVLQEAYDSVFPSDSDDDDDDDELEKFSDKDKKTSRAKSARNARSRRSQKDDDDEDEEDEEEVEEEDDDDDDEYITIYDEDELDEMKVSELKSIGRELGIKGVNKKADLIDQILDAQDDLLDDE